jgi:Predicted membrane protein (DUF2306)
MSTTVLQARAKTRTFGWRTRVIIALAMLGAIFFILVAAVPYFSFLASEELARRAVEPIRFASYWPKRAWLLTHIAGGLVALLTGPVQLWLGLANQRMDLHRKLGLLYISGMSVGSIGAIGLSVQTDFGWVFGAGLFSLAIAWILTTGLAFIAIRKTNVQQHKEWTIRSYVVTFAFVTFRIIYIALQGAQIGDNTTQLAFSAWICWAVPLLITEALLQGKKIFRPIER